MADWGGFLGKSGGFGGGSLRNEEDFDEEDVWGVAKERDDYDSSPKITGSSSSAWRLPAAPRKIPRANTNTLPISDSQMVQGSSAPMNIPDWSKIYGKNSKKDSRDVNNNHDCGHYHDDDGEEDEDDVIPPHEWIARKLARSQISSFSVCEGIGRTLKGRDLSKVRNAILTKTGFIE